MKAAEADILIVPGWKNSSPDHWQSRWQAKLSTARRVMQDDWERPDLTAWSARLVEAVAEALRPVVIIAHSCGVPTVIHAAPRFSPGVVRGAFLVSPPDFENGRIPDPPMGQAPVPSDPLSFPSLLIASRTDIYCDYECAANMANAWGSRIVDAGDAGHITDTSGHGPWPEGSLTFAQFISRL